MLTMLTKAIRQYRKDTILSPIFMIIEVFIEIQIPLYVSRIIDSGIETGNVSTIKSIGIILIAFIVLSFASGTLSGIFAAKASTGFAANLRYDLYQKIQTFSFVNIDKYASSGLVTRLTTDINNIMLAYQSVIRQFVRAVIMIVFAIITVFSINAQIGKMLIIMALTLGFILIFIAIKAHPLFARAIAKYDWLNKIVQENLYAIRVVKSFVREDIEKSKFKKVSDEIYSDFMKANSRVAFNPPFIQFCSYFCIILISWIGSKLVVSMGVLQTGQLMSLFTYLSLILMNLMLLTMVFVSVIISKSSVKRILEVFEETPNIKSPENAIKNMKNGAITFKNMNFSYAEDGSILSLENINISIKSGETIGIIGATGSGKSSFVGLIPRLYDATRGEILVGGENVKSYDLDILRENIAMVLQKNTLFSGTIKENIRWGNAQATDSQIKEVCKLAQAHDFITSFPDGYDTHIEQGGTNVSGGQRQRLCIARALIKNPKIIILDDSTSALDTKTDSLIRQAFREKIPNTTKLIISQRISSIEDSDRIIVIDEGKINAIGTHRELVKANQVYQEIYEIQTKSGGDFDVE